MYTCPQSQQTFFVFTQALWRNRCMFYDLSPNSLLLHGLHFLSTDNHIVYDLFLFICQVWTRTRAWLHGPVPPARQTCSPVDVKLLLMILLNDNQSYICIHAASIYYCFLNSYISDIRDADKGCGVGVCLLTSLYHCVKDHASEECK